MTEDFHLLTCPRCSAPDEWISFYDWSDGYSIIWWDCYCDVCGYYWVEAA